MKTYLVQSIEPINTSNGKEGEQHLNPGTWMNSQGRVLQPCAQCCVLHALRNDAQSTAGPAQPTLQGSKQKHRQLQPKLQTK